VSSQTTTTIIRSSFTGEIQDVRFGGDSNNPPTLVPREFWRTLGRAVTLGYMSGSPVSPVHTMCETSPGLVDASVQADDVNFQMLIRLFYLLQRRLQLNTDIEDFTIQVHNERARQENFFIYPITQVLK
jgi:hypothetical protein